MSGGPNIATSHSNKLSSLTNLTRKPSTGSSCKLLYSSASARTAELLGVDIVSVCVCCVLCEFVSLVLLYFIVFYRYSICFPLFWLPYFLVLERQRNYCTQLNTITIHARTHTRATKTMKLHAEYWTREHDRTTLFWPETKMTNWTEFVNLFRSLFDVANRNYDEMRDVSIESARKKIFSVSQFTKWRDIYLYKMFSSRFVWFDTIYNGVIRSNRNFVFFSSFFLLVLVGVVEPSLFFFCNTSQRNVERKQNEKKNQKNESTSHKILKTNEEEEGTENTWKWKLNCLRVKQQNYNICGTFVVRQCDDDEAIHESFMVEFFKMADRKYIQTPKK